MVDGACLQKILQEEADYLDRMVELEGETQSSLVRGDAGELEKINLQKEKLISGLSDLEQQRRKLLSEDVTLEEFLQTEEPHNRRELSEIKKAILNLHTSLQRRLEINRYLLHHNLHFTRQAMTTLFPGMKDTLYASRGEKAEQRRMSAGLLDKPC
jgi:flagellar biosynthesis/type III secretory pathway chaperone